MTPREKDRLQRGGTEPSEAEEPRSSDLARVEKKVGDRFTMRLSLEAQKAVEELMQIYGNDITVAEVFRRALSTELFVSRVLDRGHKIYIEGEGDNLEQIVFADRL